MTRADANGSFLISGGKVNFIGQSGGDDNQIVTFNGDNSSFESTNLDDLVGNACVSQYTDNPPSTRPSTNVKDRPPLEIGDLWTDRDNKLHYIWDGDEWIFVKTINGNPIGTIIETVITDLLAPPPLGYLRCDGLVCPPEFEELRAILFANQGDFLLPNRAPGFFIKF